MQEHVRRSPSGKTIGTLGAWTEYLATFQTTSGDASLGNGSIAARFCVTGATCSIVIVVSWGTTTTLGAVADLIVPFPPGVSCDFTAMLSVPEAPGVLFWPAQLFNSGLLPGIVTVVEAGPPEVPLFLTVSAVPNPTDIVIFSVDIPAIVAP